MLTTLDGGYEISDDPARLDFDAMHAYLSRSYWVPGISMEMVRQSAAGALCFGLYAPDGPQIGFARVVTDKVRFAYLSDVYVLEDHRGRGLGKALVGAVMAHPDVRSVHRMLLHTRDGHGLYRLFGFNDPASPERIMEWRGGGSRPAPETE